MKLSDLLRDLAGHYRQFGDVPVLIETNDAIVPLSKTDADIFNLSDSVTVILEVEGLTPTDTPHDIQIPNQRQATENTPATKRRSRKQPRTAATR